MATNILMPALSPTMEEGNLVKWHVKEGDKVYSGPGGAEGLACFPDSRLESVIESAEECPGECIFLEVDAP